MAVFNSYFILLLYLLVFASVNPTLAQQQKVGYVDTDYILSNMSEYQSIQQQLASQSSEWDNKLEEMKKKIEKLKEDFEAKEILYTDELREERQQEIERQIENKQQFLDQKFGAEGEYFQLQKKLLEPIQRKVMNAVTIIAKQEGFDYIFDRAEDSNMLYGSQEWNLNDKVLQQLGITLNNTSN